ncbi:MAG TPA: CAP domain-containing protein [Candidatus Limnocylindrales bacterium]|nr:CAP domain-containing protein [Candidatus Limnocylindrales bacterium]
MPFTPSGAQRASRRHTLGLALTVALGLLVTVAPSGAQALSAQYPTVEAYYLRLLNCTRTGGWVRSDGSCAGYGSGRYSAYVPPIKSHSGIAAYVARPYAKLLAVRGLCSHYANGDPASRLRKAGYTGYTWGENIGCRNGYTNLYKAVLASHLVFQSERSTNGGHWRNMKNPRFTYVGIGVWYYAKRVRLVTDFYRP